MSTLPPARIHPLEVFAPLRRWPRSLLRDLCYTLLLNCVVALLLTAAEQFFSARPAPLAPLFGAMLLGANLIGFLVHATLALLRRLLPRMPAMGARLVQLAACATSALGGLALTRALLAGVDPLQLLRSGALRSILPYAVFTAVLVGLMLLLSERRIARETAAARQQEQLADAARLLAEARLRALQAQIEPHFLYNTLANVLSLIGPQPQQAAHMLTRFIDYLRASLAASRADTSTLGFECDLVRAYLDVLAVRLGTRLRWRLALDPACAALPIAPMLLQPLVENAIMHGIEPKLAGGEIVVRVYRQAERLCIEVSDSGVGLHNAPARPGGGVGLSNLRERLQQLYGTDAQLQLFDNQPCGVTARLLLPSMESLFTPRTP